MAELLQPAGNDDESPTARATTDSAESTIRRVIWPCASKADGLHVPSVPTMQELIDVHGVGEHEQITMGPLHPFINFIHDYTLQSESAIFLPPVDSQYGERMVAHSFTCVRQVLPGRFTYYEAHRLLANGSIDWKFRPAEEGVQETQDLKEMLETTVKCEECGEEYSISVHYRGRKAETLAFGGVSKEPGSESEGVTRSATPSTRKSSTVFSFGKMPEQEFGGGSHKRAGSKLEQEALKRSKGSEEGEGGGEGGGEVRSQSSKEDADDEASDGSKKDGDGDRDRDNDTPKAKKTINVIGVEDLTEDV